MKTEIYIATHKAYDFPQHLSYIPIHVGKALTDLNLGILGDNTGDNISELNKSFCELTALYWMWKNSDADILGLVHYRRHFSQADNGIQFLNSEILDPSILENLDQNTIILPKISVFKAKKIFPISVKKQYISDHYNNDWQTLKNIVLKIYPEYTHAFTQVEKGNKVYLCNMAIMHRQWFDKYCNWLFDILFTCQKEIDISTYDNYQKRIFGFMSERLLNVFIYKHKNDLNIREIDLTNIES